ncbi:MAG TPA: nucleotidyltransferase [Bacteroidota bacterium]|nr:nucleotidyltransferase [Bacteroidota bacterium]
MKVEKDYEEFVRLLNAQRVEYLLVGAYAMAQYTEPRNTGDIDFLINPTKKNAKRVLAVLKKFGFGKLTISESDLLDPEIVIQLGFPPVRIDLITSLGTAKFDDLYKKKLAVRLGRVKVHVISLDHLIASKKEAGRPKDIADLAVLLNSQGRRK